MITMLYAGLCTLLVLTLAYRVVQVRKRGEKDQEVDIYMALEADKAKGFAIVASEPRKFTILNIVGSIDLEQIASLQRHVDLHVDLDGLDVQ